VTDTELDILKKRRLLQMQKRLQTKKTESQVIGKDKETSVSLNQVFVGKAWGVLEAARHQYPKELKRIEEVLLTLISEGQNKGENQRRRTLQFLSSIGLKGET
jgi:DNA-binding TFAR19-related protein (PDSD5 family)